MLKYLKNKNEGLFNSLENLSEDYGNVINCQNYIPIYDTLFIKKEEDNEETMLVSNHVVNEISHIEGNKFDCTLLDISNNIQKKNEIFIKFSPIMNVTRYLTGKYEKEENIYNLPKNNESNSHSKILDINNSSYTDSFFSYISSILLNDYKMFHGINYYGSLLGIKNNYKVNIGDDLDYLIESEYFMTNIDNNYSLTGDMVRVNEIKNMNNISKKYKSKLEIKDDWKDNASEPMIEDKMMDFEDVFISEKNETPNEIGELTVFNINKDMINDNISLDEDSDDSNSSRSVNTGEISDDEFSSEDEDECSEDECSEEDLDFIDVNVVIKKFPVQLICMEHCENTFDSLIENGLGKDEWISALFQIIMILIIYQKSFWFTHNDLHSNNIMFQETSKKFMYYKYNDIFYKIPTHGRIYKIIDFGRSIYKFKKYLYCPDAYKKGEDAASQYNFGTYYEKKKKEVMPNFSFDLCRLACSVFDNIFTFNMSDDYSQKYIDMKCKKDEIANLINDWCKDDKGRNVLYTSDGEERYPEFKLYKMIARTVNNNLPHKQLEKSIFSKFVVSKKMIRNNLRDKNVLYLDIDVIPKMYAE